jgi:hypothetical protein
MNKIKSKATIKHFKDTTCKHISSKISFRFSQSFIKRKLLKAFKQFKQNSVIKVKTDSTKKSIIVHFLMHKIRNYFSRWRYEADRREVVRYNEEEGKVRVE